MDTCAWVEEVLVEDLELELEDVLLEDEEEDKSVDNDDTSDAIDDDKDFEDVEAVEWLVLVPGDEVVVVVNAVDLLLDELVVLCLFVVLSTTASVLI